jgi:glutathione S-transferase
MRGHDHLYPRISVVPKQQSRVDNTLVKSISFYETAIVNTELFMSTPVFYGIEISPWSEKARWALDYHKIPYEEIEYVPLFDAPKLRLKTLFKRKFGKKLTFPMLFVDRDLYTDSFDIALYAENTANSQQLFPKAELERIKRLNAISDRLLNIFRAEIFKRTMADREAQLERIDFVPEKWREPSLKYVSPMIGILLRKYPVDPNESTFALLEEIRAELDGGPYVLDEFSYADITLAQPLQFVVPLDNRYIPLGVQQRKTMTEPELAKEFKDLVDWRDQLYDKHRH